LIDDPVHERSPLGFPFISIGHVDSSAESAANVPHRRQAYKSLSVAIFEWSDFLDRRFRLGVAWRLPAVGPSLGFDSELWRRQPLVTVAAISRSRCTTWWIGQDRVDMCERRTFHANLMP
jgi:hypothetical protein